MKEFSVSCLALNSTQSGRSVRSGPILLASACCWTGRAAERANRQSLSRDWLNIFIRQINWNIFLTATSTWKLYEVCCFILKRVFSFYFWVMSLYSLTRTHVKWILERATPRRATLARTSPMWFSRNFKYCRKFNLSKILRNGWDIGYLI